VKGKPPDSAAQWTDASAVQGYTCASRSDIGNGPLFQQLQSRVWVCDDGGGDDSHIANEPSAITPPPKLPLLAVTFDKEIDGGGAR